MHNRVMADVRTSPLLACVLLALFLVACSSTQGTRRDDVGARLRAWTEAAQIGDTVQLTDFTNFDWDRAVVLGPYSTNEQARNALGFDWDVETSPIYDHENVNLIGFAKVDRIVAWTLLARSADTPPGVNGIPLVVESDKAAFTWTGSMLEPLAEPS
jgi:hypothetical protein